MDRIIPLDALLEKARLLFEAERPSSVLGSDEALSREPRVSENAPCKKIAKAKIGRNILKLEVLRLEA